MHRLPIGDLVLALLLSGVAVTVLWATAGLPPPRWEPLGPASLPRTVAWGLLFLAGVLAAGAVLRAFAIIPPLNGDAPTQAPGRRVAASLAFVLATVATVWAMYAGWVGFRPATFGLILFSVLVLSDFSRRAIIPALVLATVLAFGVHYVMTQFLAIRLP